MGDPERGPPGQEHGVWEGSSPRAPCCWQLKQRWAELVSGLSSLEVRDDFEGQPRRRGWWESGWSGGFRREEAERNCRGGNARGWYA